MKMFTKLNRLMMMLLLSSAFIFVQAQDAKYKTNNLVSDIQPAAKVKVMNNTKGDIAADVVNSNFQGQVTEVYNNVDLSKIGNYGSQTDALLYDNGPLVTHVGVGAGGANVSALQTDLGMLTLGGNINHNVLPGDYFYFADDFTASGTWTISSMKFFGYQTNSTTTSTFTGAYVQIWNGNPSLPGSSVVYGDLTTNRLISTGWTNSYRAAISTLTNAARPIMEVLANMNGCVLSAGTYWVQVGLTGSLASGPWAPPISILGQPVTGNSLQKVSTGWVPWLDTGTGTPAQGLPFIIYSPAVNDVAVTAVTSPASGEIGVQSVTIDVSNLGTASQSNIPVSYNYGGNTFNGTVPGPVAYGATVSYTFPQTINPPLGANTLTACTMLAGDESPANDCKVKDFYITPVYTCYWTINLYDDFGDGWNGASVSVIVDGFTALPNATLAGGFGPATYSFGTNTGSVITTTFVNGAYPEECSYEIVNNFGSVEGSTGPTGVIGTPPPNLALTGNCECVVPCPPGSFAEGEAQIPNLGTDVTNGGCNMASPTFSSIASGQTYCGQTNTYTTATGVARDTDWYRFDASSSPSAYWTFNISVTAEFSLQVLLIDAGSDDCTDYGIVGVATANACETAVISGDYPSGIYYIWVGPQTATGNPYPAGGGPYDYVLSYTGVEVGAPIATISATSFTKTLAPGGSTTDVLTIGNTSTNYPLEFSATTEGAYLPVWSDNFDSYVAGLQLAGQSGGAWTTWGGTTGTPDDGFVTAAQSFSPANSFVVTPNIDQVRLFGDLSSGVYKISFMQYIPVAKAGYFNVLSDFTFVTGGYWAMDCFFNVGGAGALTANHTTTAFTWVEGAWKLVELVVDLDNNSASFYYDGALIYSWPWTEGSSSGTGPLIIDAMDLFGASPDDEMYVDDVKLEVAGNDWLTINGGLGSSGSIGVGSPAINLNLGFDATGKAVGTYTKFISLATNELGAKTSYTIPVTMYVGYALTGNVYYGNTGTKSMQNNTTVTLTPGPTVPVGVLSAYDIRPLANGSYSLTGETTKPGNNAQITTADGITATRMAAGIGTPYSSLSYRAADVNKSNTVTTSDAILIKRRAAGLPSAWSAPVFVFDGPFGPPNPVLGGKPVIINNANATMELRCLLSGDLNSSYTPPAN